MSVESDLHALAGLTPDPVTVAEAAAVLGVDSSVVLEAGARLAERAAIREEGAGWIALTDADVSGPALADLAAKLADVVGDGRPGTKGRLLATAGRPQEAIPLLVEAAGAGDADAAALALEIGPPRDPVQAGRLHLSLASHHRGRGESEVALDHARRAVPMLDPAQAIDALGFISQLHDDRQRPHEAAVWANLAAGRANDADEHAKEGSLLTLASRALSRLGFADEAEAAARKGRALVEAHGTPTQRARARSNAAWSMLDHGDAAGAAAAFASVADLAGYVGGDLEEAARLASRARALFHAGRSAEALAEHREALARAGDAAAPQFLAHLAYAEGATLHRVGESAVDAADRVVSIVDREMPAWQNVGHLTAARAHRVAGDAERAAEHLATALEATPDGIDGIRIRLRCEVERLQQLPAGARWPKDDAERLTDALLQAHWYAPAAELMGLRARHEKGTDWGAQAVALASRLGSPLLAAEAAETAGAWDRPEGALAAQLVADADEHIADEWREAWEANPAVVSARAVTAEADAEAMEARLDDALTRAGLVGDAASPAQRAAEGLTFRGRRTARGWLAPVASWAAAVVAIGVVWFLVADSGPSYAIVEAPEQLGGTHLTRGGPTNQGVSAPGVDHVEGLYWEPVVDLGQDLFSPITTSVGVVVADGVTGRLYGFDQASGRAIWAHEASGPIAFQPVVANGVDGGGSPQPRVVWATSTEVAARPFLGGNEPETWRHSVEGTVVGQPVVGPSDTPTTSPVYVPIETSDGPAILALDGASGQELWTRPLARGVASDLAATDTGIVFVDDDGRLIVLDPRTSDALVACDLPTGGAIRDQAPIVAGTITAVPYPGGDMGLYTNDCGWGVDFGNGRLPQPQLDMDTTRRPAMVDETFVYLSERALNRYDPAVWDPERHTLDPSDLDTQEKREQAAEIQGEMFIWDAPFLPPEGDVFTTDPIVAGNRVLMGTRNGLVIAIDLDTGTEVWREQLEGQVVGELATVDGAIFATTSRGMLFALGGPEGPDGPTPPDPAPYPAGTEPPEEEPDPPSESTDDTGDEDAGDDDGSDVTESQGGGSSGRSQ